MWGAGIRGIGALIAAIVTASCGWPEYAFDPGGDDASAGDSAGAGVSSGGSSTTGGSSSGHGGAVDRGGSGGSSGLGTCTNEQRDGLETGVDCGGGDCPPCGPGGPCVLDVDCEPTDCTSHGVCELLSCKNDVADGSETDQDCGGADCEKRCEPGDECRENADCASGLCGQEGKCIATACEPSSGPCGTPDCPCANGRDCMKHDDCASGNCASGTCGEGPLAFSRNDEPGAGIGPTPAILQAFLVRNDAPSAIPLGELSLRYFFTSDGVGEQPARCDDGRAATRDACQDVATPVFSVSPAGSFVDSYVEVRFPAGTELALGAQTSEIPVTVEPSGGEAYTQSNDYSFVDNASFRENTKVTLYRRGILIWGTEPPALAGAKTNVR